MQTEKHISFIVSNYLLILLALHHISRYVQPAYLMDVFMRMKKAAQIHHLRVRSNRSVCIINKTATSHISLWKSKHQQTTRCHSCGAALEQGMI
jgi:hypothetical protein